MRPKAFGEWAGLYAKAFAMGICDLIPGVSGGTVAFVTGIYEQLLRAITSLDRAFVGGLIRLRFREAFARVPLRFMAVVLLGIGTAVLSLSHPLHYLMTNHPVPMGALFFGLIAASSVAVFLRVKPLGPIIFFNILLGVVLSYVAVGAIPIHPPEGLWFFYPAGLLSITAMMLPGVSGSFLLLILGRYEAVISALKFPFSEESLSLLAVFSAGAVTGLLLFSRVLSHLMSRYRRGTTAFLTGVLVGSLRKIWPWDGLPQAYDGEFLWALGLVAFGFLAVFLLERASCSKKNRIF